MAFDRSTLAIRSTCSGPVDRATLHALETLAALHPQAVDVHFARACLLDDLGRPAAAKRAYARVLELDPAHCGALTDLATLAYAEGRTTVAARLYRRVLDAAPASADACANLANVLADRGDDAGAAALYERALREDAAHPVARYALGRDFAEPVIERTRSTADRPVRVLVPVSITGGNLVSTLLFDRDEIEVTRIVVESWPFDGTLPPHDLLFNAVADADRSAAAFERVDRMIAASGRPCINAPDTVRATARAALAAHAGLLRDIVFPRTLRFARGDVTAATLAAAGFAVPLLLRTPGYHAGRHFARVTQWPALEATRDSLPGAELLAIAFVDTRRDGRYDKYRMLIVDGRLVPLHLAVAQTWNVHYFAADNTRDGDARAREAAYLADPAAHLGERAMTALASLRDRLGLDYGGIDFGLDAAGNVVVFEANATFAIYAPDDDATAAYRQPAVDAALEAVRAMVRARAGALRSGEPRREDRAFDQRKELGPA